MIDLLSLCNFKIITELKEVLSSKKWLAEQVTDNGDFDDLERVIYLAFLRWLQLSPEQLKTFSDRIHADLDGVFNQLRAIEDQASREAIAHCFCLISAADGVIKPSEKKLLAQLLDALDQTEQLHQTEEMCDRFRKETGKMAQAVGAVGDAVSDTAGNATEAMDTAMGWVKGRLRPEAPSREATSDSELKADAEELEIQVVLQMMRELNSELAVGEINKENYEARWIQLEKQLLGKQED